MNKWSTVFALLFSTAVCQDPQVFGSVATTMTEVENVYFPGGTWLYDILLPVECVQAKYLRSAKDDLKSMVTIINSSLTTVGGPPDDSDSGMIKPLLAWIHVMINTSHAMEESINQINRQIQSGWGYWDIDLCTPNGRPKDAPKTQRRKREVPDNDARTVVNHNYANMGNISFVAHNSVFNFNITINIFGDGSSWFDDADNYSSNPLTLANITKISSNSTQLTLTTNDNGAINTPIQYAASDNVIILGPRSNSTEVVDSDESDTTSDENVSVLNDFISRSLGPDGILQINLTHHQAIGLQTTSATLFQAYKSNIQTLRRAIRIASTLARQQCSSGCTQSITDILNLLRRLKSDMLSSKTSLVNLYDSIKTAIEGASNQQSISTTVMGIKPLSAFPPIEYQQDNKIALDDLPTPQSPFSRGFFGRRKRSLIPFVGKALNVLFGVATEDQAKDMSDAVASVHEQGKLMSAQIARVGNDFRSAVKLEHDYNDQLFSSIAHRIDNITGELKEFHSTWVKALGTLKELELRTAKSVFYQEVTAQLSFIQGILTNGLVILNRHSALVQDIKLMASTGCPTISFLPKAAIDNMIVHIRAQLDSNSGVIPILDYHQLYRSPIVKMTMSQAGIIAEISMPIVDRLENYKTWAVQTLPFLIGQEWFRLTTDYFVIISPDNLHTWTGLTQFDYNQCRQDPLRDCHQAVVWSSDWDISCLPALIKGSQLGQTQCQLMKWPMPPPLQGRQSIILQTLVAPNTWMISTNNPPPVQDVYCGDNHTLTSSERLPSTVSLISVGEQCSVVLGTYALVPRRQSMGRTQTTSKSYVPVVNLSYKRFSLNKVLPKQSNWTIPNPKWESHNPLTKEYKILSEAQTVTLRNVMRESEANQSVFMTQVDALEAATEDRLSKLKNSLYHPWSNFWSIIHWIWTIVNSILITVMLVLVIRNGGGAGSVLAGFVPSAHAARVNVHKLLGVISTTPMPSMDMANRSVEIGFKIGVTPDCTQEPTSWWTTSNIVMMLTMFHLSMIMMMCMWWNHRSMKRVVKVMSYSLGYVPQNKMAIHHVGELRVLGTFSVCVSSWCRRETISTVTIQLATLPGVLVDWSLKQPYEVQGFATGDWSGLFSMFYEFKLNWGPNFCLMHSKFNELDTCHGMPSSVRLRIQNLKLAMADLGSGCGQRVKVIKLVRMILVCSSGTTILHDSITQTM